MVFGSLPISTATAQDSGIGLLKQMIAIAADNGGVGRTEALTALKQRIDALPKPARGDRKQARQANDKGLAAYKAGQYELAKEYFLLASRSDPADAEIAGNLAMAYLDLGDMKKVIETQTAALMLAPGRSASWVILARYYAQQDQQREAIACYALTFHFSQNQNKTREFLQKLATNNPDQPKVQQAAHQALQLSLIQGNSETVGAGPVQDSLDVPLPPAPTVSISQPSLPTQTILYEGDNENPSKEEAAPEAPLCKKLEGYTFEDLTEKFRHLDGAEVTQNPEKTILTVKVIKEGIEFLSVFTYRPNHCNDFQLNRKTLYWGPNEYPSEQEAAPEAPLCKKLRGFTFEALIEKFRSVNGAEFSQNPEKTTLIAKQINKGVVLVDYFSQDPVQCNEFQSKRKQKPNDVYMTDEEKFYTQNPEFLYRKFLVRDLFKNFIDANQYAQLTNTSKENLQNVIMNVISVSNARLFQFMTIREKHETWSMDDVLIDSGFGAQGDLNQNQRNQLFNDKFVFGGKLEPTLLKYIFDSKITIKRLFEDEDKIMGKIDVCMTEQKDLPPSQRQKDPKEYCLISIERNR